MGFAACIISVSGNLQNQCGSIHQKVDDRVNGGEVVCPKCGAVQFEREFTEHDEAVLLKHGWISNRLRRDDSVGLDDGFGCRLLLNGFLLDYSRVAFEVIVLTLLCILFDFLLELVEANGMKALVSPRFVAASELE